MLDNVSIVMLRNHACAAVCMCAARFYSANMLAMHICATTAPVAKDIRTPLLCYRLSVCRLCRDEWIAKRGSGKETQIIQNSDDSGVTFCAKEMTTGDPAMLRATHRLFSRLLQAFTAQMTRICNDGRDRDG